MAKSTDTTDPRFEGGSILVVCFWHDDQVEATAIVSDPDAALKAAQRILATRDALYVGDHLTVEGTVRPNLIQRGLA